MTTPSEEFKPKKHSQTQAPARFEELIQSMKSHALRIDQYSNPKTKQNRFILYLKTLHMMNVQYCEPTGAEESFYN